MKDFEIFKNCIFALASVELSASDEHWHMEIIPAIHLNSMASISYHVVSNTLFHQKPRLTHLLAFTWHLREDNIQGSNDALAFTLH